MDRCALCGVIQDQYHTLEEHHLLNGIGNRKKADKYGLTVKLCHRCHSAVHHFPARFLHLKKMAQRQVMNREGWDKARFIKEFGKNYLEDE